MGEGETLRQRMLAAGVDLPAEIAAVVFVAAGPMITSLDTLLEVPLGDLEPFVPERRLPGDAAE